FAKLLSKLSGSDDGVEKRCMDRVHGVFQDLQPVTRIEIFLARDETIARPGEAVVHRERWLLVRRAHIGKHDPVILVDGVGTVTETALQRAVRRLTWGLQ